MRLGCGSARLSVCGQVDTKPEPQPKVGRMRLHFKPEPAGELLASKVTIEIAGDTRPIYLTGIFAREAGPGWITLEVPPLEHWDESLRWLTPLQRERIAEPTFFELLQREISRRLPAVVAG